MGYKWLVLFSLWAARLVRQPTMPLKVTEGWLRGSIANDGSHAAYYAIPYAASPERFQEPKPPLKWNGTFEAVNEHVRCIYRYSPKEIIGQENCLTLNVYTPLQRIESLYPVMVFIHGGGFRTDYGSPFMYGSEYLNQHGVILVTFNYRLEVLGFLCLGIKEVPGNVGLKDQVAALKWVKTNIRSFGGDPDNITIFGESAGSASVLYHIISPMSRGLFHKAIMQSGSAISDISFQLDPLKTASQLAQQLGHNTNDPNELYKIFKEAPLEKIYLTRIPRTKGNTVMSEYAFRPCVEKKFVEIEHFLPDNPYNLIVRGQYYKVPMIVGYNSAEGYLFATRENDTMIQNMNFYDALPSDLEFPSEDDKIETADTLKKMYVGEDEISRKTMPKLSFYHGDSAISYPVILTIDLFMKTSDYSVFSYKFSYDGWLNMAKLFNGYPSKSGACHGDELFYIFKYKIPIITVIKERLMIKKITTMWTNFAKYSEPIPETTPLLPIKWEPTKREDAKLLVIDKEFTMEPLWSSDIMLFWNETYAKYRRTI